MDLSRLRNLNIFSADDLVHHYPFRYEDLRKYETGLVTAAKNIYTRSGKTIQKISVKIGNNVRELTYFNQTYLVKTLKPGIKISLSGNEYEVNGPLIHTGRLVPVYPETKGISSKQLRRLIWNQLKQRQFTDPLPDAIRKKFCLIGFDQAIRQIHYPADLIAADKAKKRLAFEEMLQIQIGALARKKAWQKKKLAFKLKLDQEKILNFISRLPFVLTTGQNRVIKEVLADLTENKPMNRLLQGEVGSGKTVVAAVAMYAAYLNGFQSFLMAPTEILANQHYQTLIAVFAKTGIKIGLVTAAKKTDGDILVGTHALLFKKINPEKLGLLVIDEQHRFGVRQRSKLLVSKKVIPHLLTMTATPIPRTIALTVYSDLDLSILTELPQGRQTVKTWVVKEEKRLDAYRWIAQEILKHHSQAFIVCPLIETSDKETMKDVRAVTGEFNQLKSVFSQLKLGLIHGRLKSEEKNKLIKEYKKNSINILVATPVIEVGMDIPNASIMMIENAERFGLAQLHQLRGRVGRSGQTAYCLIFSQNKAALTRLKYLETNFNGMKLAELDLKLRGPGEIYGTLQHGFINLKLADPLDLELIALTKQAAEDIMTHYAAAAKTKNLFPPPG